MPLTGLLGQMQKIIRFGMLLPFSAPLLPSGMICLSCIKNIAQTIALQRLRKQHKQLSFRSVLDRMTRRIS
jgi:hypothetical protein